MNRHTYHLLKQRWLAAALLASSLVWASTSCAQLTWGIGGNGGDGTWDTSTVDWWNSSTSTNVPWTNGSSAIFTGTGGTVTATFPGPSVSDITFNSPGYTIQSGWITGSGSTLSITTNQAAAISSTVSENVNNAALVKNGAATLTISGVNFMPKLQVNAGEFLVSGTSTLFFSDVTLADAPGVVVTLGQNSNFGNIKSLSGGGATGGVLQPNNQARTVTTTVEGIGNFAGVAQDNGAGKLALSFFSGSQTMTGTNTYSGATKLTFETFVLSGNGSVLNSAITVSTGSALRLDNSATALANRVSDTADLTVQGGSIDFIGNGSTALEEQLGALKFSGAVSVSATQPGGAAALLTFADATRQNRATINFSGSGRTKWVGIANDAAGIIGAYATAGNDWATVGGDGRVDALFTYASEINGGATGDHVKLAGGGTTLLTTSATRSTLNLQNSSGSAGVLDLGAGNTLTLGDGGILTSGTSTNSVQGGTLRAGGNELVVINRNALTIDSNIGEAIAGTAFTKSGAGALTLTGTNTYSGNTVIDQGSLLVSSDTNLGTGSAIQFNGGSLVATQSFSSAKGFSSNGTPLVGTIDTGANNLVFSGASNGAISKTGTGTLTLSNPSPGTVNVTQGTLLLPNATSGSVTMRGGTLLAAGTLSSLEVDAASILDIGGSSAAALTTSTLTSLGGLSAGEITVRFGLGLSASDVWNISSMTGLSSANGAFLFDFQDLGGVTTGTSYTLINVPSIFPPVTAAEFALAPSGIAAGWSGTFSVVSNTVKVTFSSTPEPGSTLLLATGVFFLGYPRRRRKA